MTYRMQKAALLSVALSLAFASAAGAAFPGKNGRIAYSYGGGGDEGSYSSIGSVKPSGGGQRTLLFCRRLSNEQPVEGSCLHESPGHPSYSPNGARIAFDAGARIGVMNKDGSGIRLYAVPVSDVSEPAFSADGNQVVFTHPATQAGAAGDLYVLDLRSAAVRQLVRRGEQAAWSLRNRIAFVRGRNVYSIRPDGKGLRALTRKGATEPDWSPSGRQIAFVRRNRIYIARPGTRRVRRLGGTGDSAGSPAWSPDGRRLAFMDFESLNVIQTNGRGRWQLKEGLSGDTESWGYSSPSWQPLR